MLRVAVLGGRLQGVEIAYLALKAGWYTVGVDKDSTAPAAGLFNEFHSFDLMANDELLIKLMREVDFVVPALEDKVVLDRIAHCADIAGVRMAYDREAYSLSSSKIRSDNFFAMVGVPVPQPWPTCGFPLTVKPSGESGSKGVQKVNNEFQFERWLATVDQPESWVKQEYLTGPCYSIEVIGNDGRYRVFQVTELEMDAVFDCKRVLAPARLTKELELELQNIALSLASALHLKGIMDIEVILHQGRLKVLEIDARFPSQTPITVYHGSGHNLLKVLWQSGNDSEEQSIPDVPSTQAVIFEHIEVNGGSLNVCGEHIMAHAGPLSLRHNFFGAREALTNYQPGQTCWVATLIITGKNLQQAYSCRNEVIENIRHSCGTTDYSDSAPTHDSEQLKDSHAATNSEADR